MKIKRPYVSFALMLLYLLGGALIINLKLPQGPGNIDWGTWVIGYIGYAYLIAASLYYVKTGK